MAKACVRLAREQLARGNDIGWEWPKDNYGWLYPEVRLFFQELANMGILHVSHLDGCSVGVVASDTGEPMLKPWLIKTTHVGLSHAMNRRCPGHVSHAQCLGGSRTRSTAEYPPMMCALVAREVMSMMQGIHMVVDGCVLGVEDEGDKGVF